MPIILNANGRGRTAVSGVAAASILGFPVGVVALRKLKASAALLKEHGVPQPNASKYTGQDLQGMIEPLPPSVITSLRYSSPYSSPYSPEVEAEYDALAAATEPPNMDYLMRTAYDKIVPTSGQDEGDRVDAIMDAGSGLISFFVFRRNKDGNVESGSMKWAFGDDEQWYEQTGCDRGQHPMVFYYANDKAEELGTFIAQKFFPEGVSLNKMVFGLTQKFRDYLVTNPGSEAKLDSFFERVRVTLQGNNVDVVTKNCSVIKRMCMESGEEFEALLEYEQALAINALQGGFNLPGCQFFALGGGSCQFSHMSSLHSLKNLGWKTCLTFWQDNLPTTKEHLVSCQKHVQGIVDQGLKDKSLQRETAKGSYICITGISRVVEALQKNLNKQLLGVTLSRELLLHCAYRRWESFVNGECQVTQRNVSDLCGLIVFIALWERVLAPGAQCVANRDWRVSGSSSAVQASWALAYWKKYMLDPSVTQCAEDLSDASASTCTPSGKEILVL